jgi:hypothetical protein
MLDVAEAKPPSVTQRRGAPIWWWALFGAWVGLCALDSALSGDASLGSWVLGGIQVGSGLIYLGAYLPRLFFDAEGREFGAKGMVSVARRHWSGAVGLLLMFAGAGLVLASMVAAPQTLRPLDWAYTVVFVLLFAACIVGANGARAHFLIGAPISIAVAATILIAGSAVYGDRLQWAYPQFYALIFGGFVLLAAAGVGVLRFIDWMIARSERSETH